MEMRKVLLSLASIAVVVSVFAAGFTYFSVVDLVGKISGYATSSGELNLTVAGAANINFTTSLINWSTGQVNLGESYAILNTADGTVTGGNWTAVTGGLVIENIGNSNVTLDLQAGKSAASFLGGTNPGYMWNVSNVEAGSCVNITYDAPYGSNITAFGNFADTSTSAVRFCDILDNIAGSDSIEIDLNLSVPSNSLTGALTDTITAIATTI